MICLRNLLRRVAEYHTQEDLAAVNLRSRLYAGLPEHGNESKKPAKVHTGSGDNESARSTHAIRVRSHQFGAVRGDRLAPGAKLGRRATVSSPGTGCRRSFAARLVVLLRARQAVARPPEPHQELVRYAEPLRSLVGHRG